MSMIILRAQRLFCLAILFVSPFIAKTEITLPGLFSNHMVLQQKATVPIWGWASPGKKVTVQTSWNMKAYNVTAGANGYWKLSLLTPSAGGPFDITVTDGKAVTVKNILIGEVWLCGGQSNMEMPMKGYMAQPILGSNEEILNSTNQRIRLLKVSRSSKTTPQDTSHTATWMEASPMTVSEFSATGWYFGSILQKHLDVPVGLISCNYGGSTVEAWMDAESLKDFKEVKVPGPADTIRSPNQTPAVLYNGMLHGIVGYGIRGAIWYQGESNKNKPALYAGLFPKMVSRWREIWGMGSFPFYYAQIAPYDYAVYATGPRVPEDNSAYIRDVQRKALKDIPNSGMAVLTDVGEEKSIHPANKKIVGQRLALLALHDTYGMTGFGHASPLFDALEISGSVATVKFLNAQNGLTSFGKPITNVEIAGADKVFHQAQAVIIRGTLQVSSPMVKQPVAVRYAFKDWVVGELFNTEGLPVSSFRTDNW